MPDTATMEAIVSLCKRRGFIFPASEIYGGLNGFWDYGPLGTALKNNVRRVVARHGRMPTGWPRWTSGIDRWSRFFNHPEPSRVGGIWPRWRLQRSHGGLPGIQSPLPSRPPWLPKSKGTSTGQIFAFVSGDESSLGKARKRLEKYIKAELDDEDLEVCSIDSLSPSQLSIAVGPDAKEAGTLTEPRQFNLMFKTYVGALQDEDAAAYLRPEQPEHLSQF